LSSLTVGHVDLIAQRKSVRQTSLVFANAAVNEIHVATVVFDLNSQVLTLTLTTTHAEMF